MKHLLSLGALLACLAGCASSPSRVSDAEGVAAAMRTLAEFRSTSYRLSPMDLVSVSVHPDERLGRKTRVDADGTVSLPMIGTTTVAGLTIPEVQRRLEGRLSMYLVSPQVSVLVEEYGARRMYVLGEVRNPGSYPLPAGAATTALQAISTAGGFTKVAAPKRAHVLRLVNGKTLHRVIDLNAVARGRASETDVVLEPDDILYIPQSVF